MSDRSFAFYALAEEMHSALRDLYDTHLAAHRHPLTSRCRCPHWARTRAVLAKVDERGTAGWNEPRASGPAR